MREILTRIKSLFKKDHNPTPVADLVVLDDRHPTELDGLPLNPEDVVKEMKGLKTFHFHRTKRKHYAEINGVQFVTNSDYYNRVFKFSDSKVVSEPEFSIVETNLDRAYYKYVGYIIKKKKEAKS